MIGFFTTPRDGTGERESAEAVFVCSGEGWGAGGMCNTQNLFEVRGRGGRRVETQNGPAEKGDVRSASLPRGGGERTGGGEEKGREGEKERARSISRWPGPKLLNAVSSAEHNYQG